MNASGLSSSQPVLCLALGEATQNALLFLPGEDPRTAPRFTLPTPPRPMAALADSRTPFCLHGAPAAADGLHKGPAPGWKAAVHSPSAKSLAGHAEHGASRGLDSPENRPHGVPPAAATLEISFWLKLCRAAGLPAPALLAAAALDSGCRDAAEAASDQGSGFTARWRALLHRHKHAGIPPEDLLYAAAPASLPRLAALQAATGGPVTEYGAALLLGLLALPEIAERSRRQGVLLIAADTDRLTAALVFQERILGVYERSSSLLDPALLAHDLEEFRLGWLPDEQVRQTGGYGCMILELPPEAEGFRPAYITGPQRHALRGIGQTAAPHDDFNQTGCFGLLHALGGLCY